MKIFDFSKVMFNVSKGKLVAQHGKLVIPTPINSTNCPTVYAGGVIDGNVESDGKEYTLLDGTKKVPVCMSQEKFYVKAGSWEREKAFLGIRVYLGSGKFDRQQLYAEIPYSEGVEDSNGNLVFTYDFPVFEYNTAHFYYLAAYNNDSGEGSQFLQNAYLTKKIVKTENGGVGPVPPEPTNTYEVYEYIDESMYEQYGVKMMATTIFEKDSENNYIKAYFYEFQGSEITPPSVYYLDESDSSTTELSKEGNTITFIQTYPYYIPDEYKFHYTFDLTTKTLSFIMPSSSMTGTFTYEPEREVYETYPIPEIVSYEVYEGLYQPSPSYQVLFPIVFGKGTTGKYEVAYVFNTISVDEAENVYYLDEAYDVIKQLDETENVIRFYSSKMNINYTFNTSTKTLFMEGPNIQGELKTNKIVKQTRIIEKFSLLFETEYELQATEYLGGEWEKIEDPTRTNVYKCTLNTKIMHNSPLSNLAYCGNYGNFEIIGGENLDVITDLKGLFSGCSGYLTSFGNISFNNVTDITNAFYDLNNITSLPNINWNKIETAKGAFNGCNNLTNFLPIYNTLRSNNVIHDVYTFNNCGINTIDGREELNQISYEWGGLYIGEVPSNTIRFKFYNTGVNPRQLAQKSSEPVGTWNNYGNGIWDWTYTPDDNSWYAIFSSRITEQYACDVIGIGDTSSIENMLGLFSSCYVIKMLAPEMDLSNCTTTENMFANCVALNTFETHLINTEKLKTTQSMFGNCHSLTTIPVFNTENVENMMMMFEDSGLVTAPEFDTSSCTEFRQMFYKCHYLTSIPSYNFNSAMYCYEMFSECTALETVPEIKMIGNNLVDISEMFYGCSSLKNISDFILNSVKSVQNAFNLCTSLVTAPRLNGLDENCTACGGLFENCTSLVTVPYLPLDKCVTSNPSLNTCTNLVNLNYTGLNNEVGLTLDRLTKLSLESIFNLIKNAIPQAPDSNTRISVNYTLQSAWEASEYYDEANRLLTEKHLYLDFTRP